jgi:hypothetical protein
MTDARNENLRGVAVVTRKGPFIAISEINLEMGFPVVAFFPPDFELLVYLFDISSPRFVT